MASALTRRQAQASTTLFARRDASQATPRTRTPRAGGSSAPARAAIRRDLVERARRRIAAGFYDSPRRVDAVLDRLWATLM